MAMTFAEIAPFVSSRLLHLTLMPTEQCNFRCVYCYEDFAAGEMARPVIDAVKALLARRIAGLEMLAVNWFGGEPLLAWPVIEEIQSFAAGLASDHPRVRFGGEMTTNGSLLTRPRFERLLTLGVRRFQVSLDGTREAHDATRLRRSGGGSFDAIWRNLLALQEVSASFEVLLRLHITRENPPAVERLLGEIAREFAGDPRFPVVLKAVRRFGGPQDAELPVLSPAEEGAVLGRLSARATALGFPDRQDVFAQPRILQGCYASALGSYVVRASGELAKCPVALGHPNNHIGRLLPDGRLDLDSSKAVGWLRGALKGDRESLRCPTKGWADDGSREGAPPLVRIGSSP
jgi:uncharacterized protein